MNNETNKLNSEGERPSIGVIYMMADRTVVVRISLQEGERVGDVMLTFPPSHPDYKNALKRVGGLKPDEGKTLYEWEMKFSDAECRGAK